MAGTDGSIHAAQKRRLGIEEKIVGRESDPQPAFWPAGPARKRVRRLKACPTSPLFDGPIMEQVGFELDGPHFDLLDRKFEPELLGVELLLRFVCTALI